MFGRWKRKVAEAARPHLEPGERVRFAVAGTTEAARGVLPTLETFGRWASGEVKTLVALVTDRNVYVLRAHWKDPRRLEAVEAKYPIGSVEARFDGEALHVGKHTLHPALFMRRDARAVVAAAGRWTGLEGA